MFLPIMFTLNFNIDISINFYCNFVPNNFISKQCVQTKRKNFKNVIIQTRKQLEATQHRQMLMTKPCPKRYADQNIWFHSLYVNLINTFTKNKIPINIHLSFTFLFFNFQQFSLTTNYTGHRKAGSTFYNFDNGLISNTYIQI